MQKQKIVQKIDPDILQFLKGRKEVPVNTMIILINIVVFFLTELTGSSLDGKHLVQWGAAYTPLIQEGHEYYRFFTCMFLHFGLTHLGNNMLVLFFLGDCLERAVGRVRYLFIYISGGMGASLISYLLEVRIGENVVSAGASGVIFAVVGALIYVVIRNKGRLENSEIIMKYFQKMAKEGTTILVSTHDREFANYADRCLWMKKGRLEKRELE